MGVKVKSEIDSLRYVPKANFDIAFEQKVKQIPLKNNYQVAVKTLGTRKSFELKPRQGYWYTPFIAYPVAEEAMIKGSIGNNTGVMMGFLA